MQKMSTNSQTLPPPFPALLITRNNQFLGKNQFIYPEIAREKLIHDSWDSELTQPQLRPHSERRSERVSELGRPEPRECAKDKRRASYLAASGFSSRIPLSPSLSLSLPPSLLVPKFSLVAALWKVLEST